MLTAVRLSVMFLAGTARSSKEPDMHETKACGNDNLLEKPEWFH